MLRHSWLKNAHEGSSDGVVRRSHAWQQGSYRKFMCRYTARYRQLAMLSFIWPARNDSRYALNKLMIIQLSYNSQINWLYPKWFSFWCNLHQIHVAVVQKSTWPFFGVIYTKKLTTERPVQSNALLRAHLVIADISRVLFFLYLLRWELFLPWASQEIVLPGKIPSQVLTACWCTITILCMATTGCVGYLRIIEMVPSWARACVGKGCAQSHFFDRPTREEGKIVDKKSKFFCSLEFQRVPTTVRLVCYRFWG